MEAQMSRAQVTSVETVTLQAKVAELQGKLRSAVSDVDTLKVGTTTRTRWLAECMPCHARRTPAGRSCAVL